MALRDAPGAWATVRRLHGFLDPAQRRSAAILLLLMVAGGLAEFAIIKTFLAFVASLAHPTSSPMTMPWVTGEQIRTQRALALGLPFVAAVIAATALRLWLVWATQRFTAELSHAWSVETQRRLLLQPYEFHLANNSARMVALLEKVTLLAYGVVQPVLQSVSGVIVGAALISGLLLMAPLVALVMLAALATFYAMLFVGARRGLARLSKGMNDGLNQRVQVVQESFGGIRDVIIDDMAATRLAKYRAVDRDLQHRLSRASFLTSAPRPLLEGAGLVAVTALVIYLAQFPGSLVAMLPSLALVGLVGQRLLPLTHQLYAAGAAVASNAQVAAEVADLLALPEPPRSSDRAPLTFAREIRLDAVTYRYPGQAHPAIAGASLSIPRGAKVALIGPTGAGKTTLADLIMGLVSPSEGQVLADDTALGPGNVHAWQRNLAHVSQSVFLTDDTILANVAFNAADGELDMDRVREALSIAQLDATIAALPAGLGTIVGERGVRLSGGERQRLGIARALYKRAELLVLDEASSAIDDATEAELLGALERRASDRTVIIIAHRRSTIRGCDLIFKVEAGRVSRLAQSSA